jgi:hypothetical protein
MKEITHKYKCEKGKFTRGNICKGRIEDNEQEKSKENKG